MWPYDFPVPIIRQKCITRNLYCTPDEVIPKDRVLQRAEGSRVQHPAPILP